MDRHKEVHDEDYDGVPPPPPLVEKFNNMKKRKPIVKQEPKVVEAKVLQL